MKLFNLIFSLFLLSVNLFGNQNSSDSTYNMYQTQNLLICQNGKVYQNNVELSKNYVLNLYKYDADLTSMYNSGYKMRNLGSGLLAGGIIGGAVGIIMMTSGVSTDAQSYQTTYSSAYYTGFAVVLLTELMIPAGIVVGVIGKNKVKSTVDKYNSDGSIPNKRTPATIELGLVDSGVGLRVRF